VRRAALAVGENVHPFEPARLLGCRHELLSGDTNGLVDYEDDRNGGQDLARELADLTAQLASLKGEANAWLSDESYDALRHRLENAYAAVEAAAVEARRSLGRASL
jgi:hypothetical protein